MTYARKSLVSLQDTPYYHVLARCVRRAWLWGYDEYARKDYSHRKEWVLDRLAQLDRIFAVRVCAYAVMSNHYHLVLYVDQAQALGWDEQEIVHRWKQLFQLPTIVDRYYKNECTSSAEQKAAKACIAMWRARLCDLSWYMRCLNEHLARLANTEDECTGRFWEGRFRSQALLDEAGLLTAMAYVDLNPVRAGSADTPETSTFTSIHQRIRAFRRTAAEHRPAGQRSRLRLQRFRDPRTPTRPDIPFTFKHYLELLEWTGRVIREDKHEIGRDLPPILTRLNVDAIAWCESMQPHGNVFGRALGRLDHLRLHALALGQHWIRGMGRCERLYNAG